MNAKDRLKSFLVYLKIGQNSFEKKAGISNGYVNNFKGSIGSEIAARISDAYPELNLHWLLTGKGEMKIADSPPPDNTSTELTGLKNEVKQLIELLTEKENRLQDMKKSIQDKDKIITLLEQQQPAVGRAAADKREVLVRAGSR